jgi:hypothetical protein
VPNPTTSSEALDVNDRGHRDLTSAALFAVVWDALAGVLGTAAVAALVRRAVRRAAAESPELMELVVVREELEYRYTLPRAWSEKAEGGPIALRVLVRELGQLLVELTGTVVIRRMEQIPELRAHGLIWRAEAN